MTPPDAVVTQSHMLMAEDALAEPRAGDNFRSRERADAIAQWARTGRWPWYPNPTHRIFADTVREHERTAQSLANLEAAVRREYSELRHLARSAARMLRDGDERDVSGRIFTELETLKNG